tara:strand:- start:596 stop:781 length:186 start_codon:yes stop_codon:yes gene_type:complete
MDKYDILIGAVFFGYLLIFLLGRYMKPKVDNLNKFNDEMNVAYILYTWITGYWWFVFFITS